MATLIYSPGIKVHVETTAGILDLTEDIANWQVQLRENGVHVFSFQLQNAQRKYDGRLLPMDRISIQLKRLAWMQVMTGYLNDGPIFQAWPGTLDMTASCTLKIPQFWPWDPTTATSGALMAKYLASVNGLTQADSVAGDKNLSKLVVESLAQVVGWPRSRIHIGQVPNTWFKFASRVGALIKKDTDMSALIGSTATVGGTAAGTLRVNIPAGNYAGVGLNAAQARNASIIYNTAKFVMNMSSRDAVMSIQCAMQESSLLNLANSGDPASLALPHDGVGSDHDSVGCFQQRPSWGSVSERMNVATSTQLFLKRLAAVEGPQQNQNPNGNGYLIQTVQVSAAPSAYDKWQKFAEQAVRVADQLSTGKVPSSADNGVGGVGNISTSGKTMGAQVAKVAYDLIKDHLNNPIIYSGAESGYKDDPPETPVHNVKSLDCSSLVDWVYYQATGTRLFPQGRGTAATQYAKCPIHIPLDLARYVQGAALFIGGAGAHHVGLSLGDNRHVAAHDRYSNPKLDVDVSAIDAGGGFDSAGLLPGIDYSAAATTQAAANQLKTYLKTATTVGPNLFQVNNPSVTSDGSGENQAFNALLNLLTFNATTDQLGNQLGGRRALINDQPFLPWLQNLINASMRSFCSAPNGDFISWFPDYFGLWGTAAVMNVQLIELQDFSVMWSDQQMVTHQFFIGNPSATTFDQGTAGLGISDPVGQISQYSLFAATSGIATMDYPEIFEAIYGKPATPAWTAAFLKRFGARPDVEQLPQIHQGAPEFFMALYLFMRRWAGMFTATIPLTFMPEIFPGMLLRIPEFGFQCYVTGVTHSGAYGASGSFTTTVEVCAPSNTGSADRSDLLALLPQGGKPFG